VKVRRAIPPTAAPVSAGDLFRGFSAMAAEEILGKLEQEMGEYFGAESVFLVSSGKAALTLILKGLATLSPRRNVVIPAYTCYSVPSAILKAGLTIVLCDVDPDTLDFDFSGLDRLVDEKTLCVLPTHLFGVPSDVDRVRRICGKKGIFVVEDAAQAMGVVHEGRKLGTLGDVGFFSLGRGKNITCGSGGIILTSSREIAESIRTLHGGLGNEPAGEYARSIIETVLMKPFLNPSLYWLPNGMPFLRIGESRFLPDFPMNRMSRFKAGVLVTWRVRMEEQNRCREMNGRHFVDALGLREEGRIYSRTISFLRFPVVAETPKGKADACVSLGHLGVSPMYPRSVNQIDELQEHFAGSAYPGAERIADTLFTLPTHVLLAERDRRIVCEELGRIGIRRGKVWNVPVGAIRHADSRIRKLRR
jgi:perosamine synthetase